MTEQDKRWQRKRIMLLCTKELFNWRKVCDMYFLKFLAFYAFLHSLYLFCVTSFITHWFSGYRHRSAFGTTQPKCSLFCQCVLCSLVVLKLHEINTDKWKVHVWSQAYLETAISLLLLSSTLLSSESNWGSEPYRREKDEWLFLDDPFRERAALTFRRTAEPKVLDVNLLGIPRDDWLFCEL